jgi:hypothetical protein
VLTRSIARAVALAATVLAAAWAAVLIVVGGFEIQIGSWRLSSHQPMRPILWGTLPLAMFVWANGVRRTADSCRQVLERLNHTVVAIGLALAVLRLLSAVRRVVVPADSCFRRGRS